LDVDTTIVGAGPYGLSIAAHLKAASRSFELFGTPLESWRAFMPAGMVLKSERFASNLWDPHRRYTLRRYSEQKSIPYQAVGSPVSLALFLDYADWFREHALGGVVRDVRVNQLSEVADGFQLGLEDGRTLTSRRVVLATGHMPFRPTRTAAHTRTACAAQHAYRRREVVCRTRRHSSRSGPIGA
jgi:FAD-dependent urate hydroxylase